MFEAFKMEFLGIPYDIRLTLFSPEVLNDVQMAYVFFQSFTKSLLLLISDYEKNPTGNFVEVVKKIDPSGVKEFVEYARYDLKELLPKDIVESLG
jgi:hypothetical protein